MEELFYNSEFPHSDLRISIKQSSSNKIGPLGFISEQRLSYIVSDSSSQQIEYFCDLGSRRVMTMSEGTVLSSSDAEAIAFISKAHTSMIALGYTFIVTDEGEQIDLSAFNINLESIALAIAKSNHISGI